MSWLFAQTWLWYLIAFVVGVLLAWLFLVLPQQRRLRTLQSVAGSGIDHDLYADSRSAAGAAASGAALFDSGSDRVRTGAAAEDPATEQVPPVDPAANSPDTTAIPIQPAPDDSTTGEIPVVSEADAAGDRAEANGTAAPDPGTAAEPGDSDPAPAADAATDPATDAVTDARIDETAAESNGRAATGATLGAGAAALAGTAGRRADPPAGSAAESATAGGSAGDTGPAADTEAADPTADSSGADSSGADSTAGSSGADDTATAPPATETAPAKGSGAGVQSLLGAAAAAKVTAGRYPGSALSGPDGAAPSDEYTIKGNADSMLFHTPESPYYGRTKAEMWFSNAEDAEAAGFTSWSRRR